jgi:peptide-methionine (S)-S-oxide reductase
MKYPTALIAAVCALTACTQPASAEEVFNAPVAKVKASESGGDKVAIFAGGCFWGIEGVFSHVKGVKSAVSGYHGGTEGQAKYRLVAGGTTDHAEAVRVVYDPKVVRYDELLQILFSVGADPTTFNYQGPDHGTQYRSAIVPMSAEQTKVAKAYLSQMGSSGVWDDPIVVKIENYKKFYAAEDYHQDFMLKNPRQGYIVRWDKPKVEALQRLFPSYYRSKFQTG